MNNPLEHNVYKPVSISHPSYFVSFALLLQKHWVQQIYTNKNAMCFDFHFYFTKFNGFLHRMLCISSLALAELYLALFNVVNNLFNFTLIVQSVHH